MSLLRRIVTRTLAKRKIKLARQSAAKAQLKVLVKLLTKAELTDFGTQHNFTNILNSEHTADAFQQYVPIGSYTDMYPWWQRAFKGEPDVTWPGITKFFALSSGTSEGASKYIPVSKEHLKQMRAGSLRLLSFIARNSEVPADIFTHHNLLVGGSTNLQFNGKNYSGDLSGIAQLNLPFWYHSFSKPEPDVMKLNWDSKIEEIVAGAKNWNVGIITGIPAWVQIILEKIIERYGLKNIHELWPDFKVYIHSGVAIGPYKESLEKLFGQKVLYYETYLASEGFFAYQPKQTSKGMKLMLNNRIFFEFVPFNENNFDDNGNVLSTTKALTIDEVEKGIDYALLISTCSGAWRYLIGDVVRFVSINNYEIKITGRTKQFLSVTGEHLSVDNMTEALTAATKQFGITCNEFTVAAVPYNNLFAHEWYIGTNNINIDNAAFTKYLDEQLSELNDDYKIERKHALKEVFVHFLPNDAFNQFLKSSGKQGGQIKFPRVLKGDIYNRWKDFLRTL